MNCKIGQVGNGFVGSALRSSFKERGFDTVVYDKYQKIGSIQDVLLSDILFLCLPTPYIQNNGFDLSAIDSTLCVLKKEGFSGLCVIKSTVEPGITEGFSNRYDLDIVHNPEFLTERTALYDFDNQKHIVIGRDLETDASNSLVLFYKKIYPDAKITICTTKESEAMKLFCNNFYAAKVMIFNEFYFLCNKLSIDFDNVRDIMLINDWINPMHTAVPGPDGKIAFGGNCFTKDTHALVDLMRKSDSICSVFESVVSERNALRKDMTNITKEGSDE